MKENIYNIQGEDLAVASPLKSAVNPSKQKNKIEMFLTDVGKATAFVLKVFRNIFGKDFEFNQFLKQCFAIGNQSLGLISVTGVIIGLVLTIQSRPVLVNWRCKYASWNGGYFDHQGDGPCNYRFDLCRKNWFKYGCRNWFNAGYRTN